MTGPLSGQPASRENIVSYNRSFISGVHVNGTYLAKHYSGMYKLLLFFVLPSIVGTAVLTAACRLNNQIAQPMAGGGGGAG